MSKKITRPQGRSNHALFGFRRSGADGLFNHFQPETGGIRTSRTNRQRTCYNIVMCTVGHWKNGVMDEEYPFWDNQSYMKQMGLAP
jgi:hypothetical protein